MGYVFGSLARLQHTDPASASPDRLIASFAMSCLCGCANSVPTKSWEGRRTSRYCPAGFPSKPFGASTHLAHKVQSKSESAQRSRRDVVDRANQLPSIRLGTSAREKAFLGCWLLRPTSGKHDAVETRFNRCVKWVLLIDGIQGHQAAATMRHPQAAFRPLSDGIRGELPLPAPVHYASQPL
jgi:hypothetical protein